MKAKEPVKERVKSIHVAESTHADLQHLKKQMGLKSISEVIDCLVQLHSQIESFPRSYVEFVDYVRSQGK